MHSFTGRANVRVVVLRKPALRSSCNRAALVIQSAASFAGGQSEDPYKVLGIPKSSDFKAVTRAYNNLRREVKNDEAKLARVEAAYNQLFMGSLTSRVQGGGQVSKDVKYADRPKYFPWRPRKFIADKNYILVIAGLQALAMAWAITSPATAGQQPVIAASMIGAIANIYKQNMIFPPPSGPGGSEDEKKQGFRNILRGVMLAFMATFVGCFVAYTLPDMVAATAQRVLPYWFYEYETLILAVGTCIAQFNMSAFFR